ncbi:MAG: hypothetical protein ACHQF2_00575 [Flavobacteriales bacterium]
MRDLICVIAVLLIAGWLLGLMFYSTQTIVQLLVVYAGLFSLLSFVRVVRDETSHNKTE